MTNTEIQLSFSPEGYNSVVTQRCSGLFWLSRGIFYRDRFNTIFRFDPLFDSDVMVVCLVCGIPDAKLVEAHGSFATASCHLCYTPYPAEEAKVCLNPHKHISVAHPPAFDVSFVS